MRSLNMNNVVQSGEKRKEVEVVKQGEGRVVGGGGGSLLLSQTREI